MQPKLSDKIIDPAMGSAGFLVESAQYITENFRNSDYFVKSIDSCALYVNASTRFTDGGEFGLGAEIGISTQKLHVRGPMGLSALTTEKYIIKGDGQVR